MSVKINKKQFLILAIFIILSIYVGTKVYDSAYENYAPHYIGGKIATSEQISADEVRCFLKTLLKYKEHHPEWTAENLSYSLSGSLAQTEPKMSAWLKRHGWSADRFFYIANRIRLIISTMQKDEEILQRQNLMRESMQVSGDEDMSSTLKREIEQQNKTFNVEKISDKEREFVKPQMEVLSKILKMN